MERKRRFDRTRLTRYQPYPKQEQFHAAGLAARERLLMAGNQLGKTYSGAAELAYHLTGIILHGGKGESLTVLFDPGPDLRLVK